MKWVFSICLCIFFSACSSTKPNMISINPYKSNYHKIHSSKTIQRVFVKSVLDLRNNPHILGSYAEGRKRYAVRTDTKMNVWLYKALNDALLHEGYEPTQKMSFDSLNVSVKIKSLNAHYFAHKRQNNMHLDLVLRVNYQRGIINESEEIKISRQTSYNSLPSKQEYERQIYNLLKSGIKDIIKKTARF